MKAEKLAMRITNLFEKVERNACYRRAGHPYSPHIFEWFEDLDNFIGHMKVIYPKEWQNLCRNNGWDFTLTAYDAID